MTETQVIVLQEDELPLGLTNEEKLARFLEPVIAKNDSMSIHLTKGGEIWRCYLESRSGKHSSASLIEFDMKNDVEGLLSSIKQLTPENAFYNKGMISSLVVLLAILVSAFSFGINVFLGTLFLPIILGTLAIFVAFSIEKLRTKFI